MGPVKAKEKMSKTNAMEAFWGQREPCEVKKCQRELYSARVSCQRGPKGGQKGAPWEPKGSQRGTKGGQTEPKGGQKGAKVGQK